MTEQNIIQCLSIIHGDFGGFMPEQSLIFVAGGAFLFILLFAVLIFIRISGGKYNFDRVQDCIRALNDKSDDIRVRACWALKVHRDPSSENSLIMSLNDNSNFVRGAAAGALGSLKRKTSVGPLEDAMKIEGDAHTREQMDKSIKRILGDEIPKLDLTESLDEKETVTVKLNTIFDKPSRLMEEKSKKDKKLEKSLFMAGINETAPMGDASFISLKEKIPQAELSELSFSEKEEYEILIKLKPHSQGAKEIIKLLRNSEDVKFNIDIKLI